MCRRRIRLRRDGQQHPAGGHVTHDEAQVLAAVDVLGKLGLEQVAGDRQRAATAPVGLYDPGHQGASGHDLEIGQQQAAQDLEVDRKGLHVSQES